MKKILSMLIVMLMIGNLLPMAIFAADEAPMEMVASISAENTVTLQVRTTDTFEWYTLEFTLNLPEGCTIATISKGANYDEIGGGNFTSNKTTGIISVMGAGGEVNENASAGKEIVTVTVDTTNAVGDELSFGATVIAADIDGNKFGWSSATVTSNTLNLSDGTPGGETPTIPTDKAYTADLDTDYENVKVGDTITVDVLVGGTTKEFASSDLQLTYTGLMFISGTSKTLEDDTAATITGADGSVRIIDYGKSYNWTEGGSVTAYTLTFTVNAIQGTEGSANVTLTGAAFSTAANAATQDLSTATVTINEQAFTVYPADLTVTLPDGFTSVSDSNTVEYGHDFTFQADNIHYTYDLDATPYQVVDNQDGTWTVKNVTSNLDITENVNNRVPKTYTITFNTLEHIQNAESLNAQEKDGAFVIDVTYNTDFSFILKDNVAVQPGEAGVTYAVESIAYATGGNVTVTGPTTEKNRTYTISGANITGNIKVTTSATPVNPDQFIVTLPAGYSTELSANPTVVDLNSSTTLTLTPEAGYKYTVSYKMGNADAVEITTWADAEGGKKTATISNITANVTVTVVKTVDQSVVNVEIKDEYLVWQEGEIGKEMHMVVITGANLAAGKIYTYDGQPMYYTTNYDNVPAYVYLVVTNADDSFTVETARAKVGIDTATAKEIVYNGDVNMVGTNNTVDANDAQFVWNMYNGMYNGFVENVTMEKYLRADMDGNGKVETNDAAEIIKLIPKN